MLVDELPSHVVVVAASNHPELLDRAARRRFELTLQLPAPTAAARREWWTRYLHALPHEIKAAPKTLAERTPASNYAELEDLGQDIRRQLVLHPGANPSTLVNERIERWRTGVPERPSAPFAPPQVGERNTSSFGRSRPTGPGPAGQEERLGPVSGRLRESLEAERLEITEQPEASAPEHVLVLEIAGEMDEFLTAVAKVPGLEYLAEDLGDMIEDTSEFAKVDQHQKRSTLRRELFVVASNERAARELESLWAKWAAGQPLKRGWATWKTVFERLVTVRQWNDNDRLTNRRRRCLARRARRRRHRIDPLRGRALVSRRR